MKTLFVALLAVAALAAPAFAQSPLPTEVVVTLPQTNADGSNLTDLAGMRYESAAPGTTGPWTPRGGLFAVPSADPAPGAELVTPLVQLNLPDGTHIVRGFAVDIYGNVSAPTVPSDPFPTNRVPPAAAGKPAVR